MTRSPKDYNYFPLIEMASHNSNMTLRKKSERD